MIDVETIQTAIENIEGSKLLIVGDVILDTYVWCKPRGVSLDGPIMVWENDYSVTWAGGAGVIARTASMLGFEVDLITQCNLDEVSRLQSLVGEVTLRVDQHVSDGLPEKTRYIGERDRLFKYQKAVPFSETPCLPKLIDLAPKPDAMMFFDFGYGANRVQDSVCDKAGISLCPLAVDRQAVRGIAEPWIKDRMTLMSPTVAELERATGVTKDLRRAFRLTRSWGVSRGGYRSVTRGKEGSWITGTISDSNYYWKCPSLAYNVIDAVGAGDHYLLGLVIAQLADLHPEAAGYLASCISACACRDWGNPGVAKDALMTTVESKKGRWTEKIQKCEW